MRIRVLALLCIVGCAGGDLAPDASVLDASLLDAGPSDTGTPDAGPSDAGQPAPDFLTRIESLDQLRTLRDTMRGDVKYLAPVEGAPIRAPLVEPCYFQNTARFPRHLFFLRNFEELSMLTPEEYEALTLDNTTRIWWGGAVKHYPNAPHPNRAEPGVVVFVLYASEASGGLVEDDIVQAEETLSACMPAAASLLAFLPNGAQQEFWARDHLSSLNNRGITVVFEEDL